MSGDLFMTPEWQAQLDSDQAHLTNPMPGDYWHEMYCPIARILHVRGAYIMLQKLSGMAGKEINKDDPKPELMTMAEFKKWISYDSMPDKTWCHVIPERMKDSP